jgi:hypothetical protein
MPKSRFPILVATGIVAFSVLVGWGAAMASSRAQSHQPSASGKVFQNASLRLKYPRAWRARHFNVALNPIYSSLVYISNQRMYNPCTTKTTPGGTESRCGAAVKHLRPGGVMADWAALQVPMAGTMGGKPLRVDGRKAVRQVRFPGTCRSIGGTETVLVLVAGRTSQESYLFTACLRSPHRRKHFNQLNAIVKSTTFIEP